MTKSYLNFTVDRDISERVPSDPGPFGAYGHKSVKVGEENVIVELTVDLAKLARILTPKIQRGQTRATLADCAIVAKVIKRRRTK